MFETAELGRELEKEAFEKRALELRPALLEAQQKLASGNSAVVILIGGVDKAGKGEVLNRLFEWLDARGMTSSATEEPSSDERERPPYWRFWMALPPKGRIGCFLGGWYTSPIELHAAREINDSEFDARMHRAVAFERELSAEGTLIIKIWLHVSKKAQRKRLEKLEASRDTAWRVTKRDWKRHRTYDSFRNTAERAIRETSSGLAPWTVIESSDERHRDIAVAEHVLDRLQKHLETARPPEKGEPAALDIPNPDTILDRLDLTLRLEKEEYEKELARYQSRLAKLSRKVTSRERGVIVVFEGSDAAGKGGAIRRITRVLDARQYRVIPIAAPTDEERAHHYLWRFWRHLPRLGKFTIYDRSWYGRVLVERVEGFASEPAWRRAYEEIRNFEEQLIERGNVVVKVWLQISADEQLARFKAREAEPWKQYKIGPEDYRNRAKSNAYELAAEEMISRTSTEWAPWTLVEAEDKRYARVKILRTLCERIEAAL
jgi:AMP-polyphosphate phosphotransferase